MRWSPRLDGYLCDMATLLMAFVLILSFASVNVPKFEQVAGSIKLAFGIDRVVPKVTIPMAETIIDSTFTLSEAAYGDSPRLSIRQRPDQQNVVQMKDFEDAPLETKQIISRCSRRWKTKLNRAR